MHQIGISLNLHWAIITIPYELCIFIFIFLDEETEAWRCCLRKINFLVKWHKQVLGKGKIQAFVWLTAQQILFLFGTTCEVCPPNSEEGKIPLILPKFFSSINQLGTMAKSFDFFGPQFSHM